VQLSIADMVKRLGPDGMDALHQSVCDTDASGVLAAVDSSAPMEVKVEQVAMVLAGGEGRFESVHVRAACLLVTEHLAMKPDSPASPILLAALTLAALHSSKGITASP
jgi:hypothetical protein